MMNLNMGIDIGNSNCVLFSFSDAGEIVLDGHRIMTSEESEWRELLDDLSSRFKVRACFEVGPHYEWLYDLLMEYCLEVEVVNPADFVLISRSQRKTDKIDAQKLAEGLHRGDLPSVYVPPKACRADRRLVSFVHKLSQDISRVKGRIRSLLCPQRLNCPYTDILDRRRRQWLESEALPRLDDQERRFLEMLLAQADLLMEQRMELDRRVNERSGEYEGSAVSEEYSGLRSFDYPGGGQRHCGCFPVPQAWSAIELFRGLWLHPPIRSIRLAWGYDETGQPACALVVEPVITAPTPS